MLNVTDVALIERIETEKASAKLVARAFRAVAKTLGVAVAKATGKENVYTICGLPLEPKILPQAAG